MSRIALRAGDTRGEPFMKFVPSRPDDAIAKPREPSNRSGGSCAVLGTGHFNFALTFLWVGQRRLWWAGNQWRLASPISSPSLWPGTRLPR